MRFGISAIIIFGSFMAGIGSHKLYVAYHHPLKHTWEVECISRDGHMFWFVRPNKELIEVYFDNPPLFGPGARLRDLAYTDDNADLRHFVKATVR